MPPRGEHQIRVWYAVLALVISCLLIAFVSVWYTHWVDDKANQRWCALMVTLDEAYKEVPPTTPASKNVAREVAILRETLGCQDWHKGPIRK